MIRNYLLIAFRSFWKHKLFSLINMAGLAIGISAALVIYLLVSYEFSFDTFHRDRRQIYRVVSQLDFPDQLIKNGGVCAPLPDAVKKEVTGIEASAAFHQFNGDAKVEVSVSGSDAHRKLFKKQNDIILTDGDYFKLFQYEWLAGSPDVSLTAPFQVVLTESRARLYFGDKDIAAIPGSTITYNDSIITKVTGVVKDIKERTDLLFKEFISLKTITATGLKNNMGWDEWGSVNSSSLFFVKLKKGTAAAHIEKQLAALRAKYAKDDYMKTVNLLQPLSALHFAGEFDSFAKKEAHKPTLYGLLAVAAFLLLLGCINFINLTTAQAALRAKEIGIRKTMGSSKFHLVSQFLGETFLLTLLATILSIVITPGILKIFSDFIPEELHFGMIGQPHIILFILLLIVVVTLLSGFYPALVLSGFKPIQVMKNQAASSPGKTRKTLLRRSLTISQFVIAQFFIIATILVSKQIKYAINKDMGFRKDAIVNFNAPWNAPDKNKRFVLLNKIQAMPEVAAVCLGGSTPAAFGYSSTTMKYNDGKKETETTVGVKYASEDYFRMYDMKLVAGRFPAKNDTAVTEYAINETYAGFLGFKDPGDAVGKFLDRGQRKVVISGVLKDFHDKSIHSAIRPLAYSNVTSNHATFHILLRPNSGGDTWKNAIAKIEKDWKEVYPDFDFTYSFFDKTIEQFYQAEKNISRLLVWATGLAIFISCLGMLGLVIYTTNQRTKEIGVRKVLGASVTQIVTLLSRDFMKLVILAFIIAAPLTWWVLNKWLEDFAYRTPVSWWVFAGGGLLMVIIALLTLSVQTVRSAIANPVKSLRTE
ncbi:MAG: ABC transporter permease [Chitinophagaceae bacterium]|nr:ABC transporter permease [Chitinophagaceae bacterium]